MPRLTLNAERSVEVLQAYLIAHLQSLGDEERLSLTARIVGEDGFMAKVLDVLHAAHDGMVCCLQDDGRDSESRMSRLLHAPELLDSDLARITLWTIERFSPAIVLDLDRAEIGAARDRLANLLAATRARCGAIKLH